MNSTSVLTVPKRIEALRAVMKEHSVDAYIIGSADPHQSEYMAQRFKTRTWISGFHGSAGTVVITKDFAGLWTDSRYFLEAEKVLHETGMQLLRQGMPDVPNPPQWLAENMPERSTVSYDALCMSIAGHMELVETLESAGIRVVAGDDLPGLVWTDRPEMPSRPVVRHEGPWLSSHEKIERLTQWMGVKRLDYVLVSALDDIAWLLNLRGSDVEYNPVFYAYLLVGIHGHTLFLNRDRVAKQIYADLNEDGVSFADYDSLPGFLQTVSAESRILLPAASTAVAWRDYCAHMKIVTQNTPIAGWKAPKTPSELEALRLTQIRDGVAMVKTLRWIENTAKNGESKEFTEFAIGEKSTAIRAEGKNYVGQSFTPIAGFAVNGAIVHYSPDPKKSAQIKGRGLLLLDTGAQYTDGTTDITRVLVLGGKATKEEVEAYTLVLKGHIALATVRFPRGTGGHQLDILARKALWDKDMNFGHGTGHGIGFFLNVHEGPQRISPAAAPVALEPGMLISNEPGFYKPGSFGIRIENMVAVAVDPKNHDFLCFETLSLCPFEADLVDAAMLSPDELSWLNSYHERVRDELGKELTGDDLKWLKDKTKTIYVLRS